MEVSLETKQAIAFNTTATEILYGGAVGGGKSYYLRVSAIRWCLNIEGIQVYLFRRTLPDLRDNHLRGPSSFHVMLSDMVLNGHCKYKTVENEFEFKNGSVLHLCYCDSENDVEKYRGAEIHILLMDELTHFSDYQFRFLRGRVRVAGLKIPEQFKGLVPRIECGSNPGSIGHAWVKRAFISPKPYFEIWKTPAEEGGMLRQFIPAKLSDNTYLTKDDPDYADRIRGMGTDTLVRAMLDGDWDIIAGQAFEKLSRSKHCIDPFDPPLDWVCFGSFDWGSTRPFSYGLWCVSNGDLLPDGRVYQRGALIRYDEWYGWNGKPNEGLRMEAAEVAEGILKLEGGRKLAYRIADPSMWKVDGGPSNAESFMKRGVILRRADNSRHNGYLELRSRIAGNEDGPMLYVTSNCHAGFWRTMPDIVMDEHRFGLKSEDVDTSQEDHCFISGTKTFGGVVGITGDVLGINGMTKGIATPVNLAETVKIVMDDGEKIVCTPTHKFLTSNGWKEAQDLLDEVCYNALSTRRVEWLLSLAVSVRSFLVSIITFAESIFRKMGCVSIEWCGRMSTVTSQMDSTSTISTEIGQTIESRILSWYNKAIICPIMANLQTIRMQLNALKTRQKNGTEAKLGENGTQNTQKEHKKSKLKTLWRNIVRYVVRHMQSKGYMQTALFIATLTAAKQRCVGVKPAGKQIVTCLHVDKDNAFALESGTIVHNCYDDARYGVMSRPWTKTLEVKKPPVDRWLKAFSKETDDSWRTT